MNALGARLAATCGILYPVLLIGGDDVIAGGDRISPDAGTPAQVLANAAAMDAPTFYLGRTIGLLGTACMLVFVGYAATRLRPAYRSDSAVPGLTLAAAAVAATLQFTAALPQFAVLQQGTDGLTPETAVLVLRLGAGFTMAMLPFGIVLIAIGYAGTRGAAVGRAVGWTGLVLGGLLIAGFALVMAGVPLGFLPLPLSWLWFVAAGVSALRRAAHDRVDAPAVPVAA